MDINDIIDAADTRRSRKKPAMFDWSINLGHVFIVLSLFISAAGLYAHDEARMSVIETKVDSLTEQNLPPRVSSLEAQNHDMHDSLYGILQVLEQIHSDLATKQDKQK